MNTVLNIHGLSTEVIAMPGKITSTALVPISFSGQCFYKMTQFSQIVMIYSIYDMHE